MTSNDIRITIDNNLDIAEPSMPPNERVHELLPMPESSEEIMTPAFNSQSEIMETKEHGPAASSSTSERPSNEERWSIPKVPYRLRQVNQEAYEPNAISIGPYHYGKEHLRAMDDIKQTYVARIFEETNLTLEEFVHQMRPLKERALNCYERPMHADLESDDNFIKMMVIDGCFIIMLISFRHRTLPELAKVSRNIRNDMRFDLLLLENQLPFFVLLELDRIINSRSFNEFYSAVLSYFKVGVPGTQIWSGVRNRLSPSENIKHLLEIVHKYCHPSSEIKEPSSEIRERRPSSKFIRSASELYNAGIDFVGEKETNLFDVTFKDTGIMGLDIYNKVLKIPTLRVKDSTERMLRSLIAYEQFNPNDKPTYVTDYALFMDNLVNTGKDVQLLCTAAVIENCLGDDEAVARMFNKIGVSICSSEYSYYSKIYDKVDKHCKGRWNTYKAKLKKDYFNSPWSVVSFLAAVVLIVATVLQTAYAVMSYDHTDDRRMNPH